jgi:hypothetical protein
LKGVHSCLRGALDDVTEVYCSLCKRISMTSALERTTDRLALLLDSIRENQLSLRGKILYVLLMLCEKVASLTSLDSSHHRLQEIVTLRTTSDTRPLNSRSGLTPDHSSDAGCYCCATARYTLTEGRGWAEVRPELKIAGAELEPHISKPGEDELLLGACPGH